MDNVTHVAVSDNDSAESTNWGADVLWWGGNEYFQLGMGKRNNVSNPVYIQPLEAGMEKEKGKTRQEHRFQITPRGEVNLKGRGKVSVEQRVECGRMCSAVYSGT
jgi:hypothetical protein